MSYDYIELMWLHKLQSEYLHGILPLDEWCLQSVFNHWPLFGKQFIAHSTVIYYWSIDSNTNISFISVNFYNCTFFCFQIWPRVWFTFCITLTIEKKNCSSNTWPNSFSGIKKYTLNQCLQQMFNRIYNIMMGISKRYVLLFTFYYFYSCY